MKKKKLLILFLLCFFGGTFSSFVEAETGSGNTQVQYTPSINERTPVFSEGNNPDRYTYVTAELPANEANDSKNYPQTNSLSNYFLVLCGISLVSFTVLLYKMCRRREDKKQ